MRYMKDRASLCNIGHFDNEIQVEALKTLESKGVKIHQWSQEILDTLEKAWLEVVEEESSRDEDFKRSWESLSTFRKNIQRGSTICLNVCFCLRVSA